MTSITPSHVMREKPRQYAPHPLDSGGIEEAQDLCLEDFSRVTTGQEGKIFLITISRRATVTVLTKFMLAATPRVAIVELQALGLLPDKVPDEVIDLIISERSWEEEGRFAAVTTREEKEKMDNRATRTRWAGPEAHTAQSGQGPSGREGKSREPH